MVPVLFSYGGWQTTNFIASEIRNPRKNLARALIIGVAAVVVLYVSVNLVCVRALGATALAQTNVPASAVTVSYTHLSRPIFRLPNVTSQS